MINIPEQYILYINIAVIALLLIELFLGYKKGFLEMGITAVRFILAFLGSRFLAPILAKAFTIWPQNWTIKALPEAMQGLFLEVANKVSWYVLIFVVCLILLFVLIHALKEVKDIPVLKQINGILGAALSLIVSLIIITLVTFVLSTPIFKNGNEVIDNSVLKPMKVVTSFLYEKVGQFAEESDLFNKLTGKNKEKSQSEKDLAETISQTLEKFKESINYEEKVQSKEAKEVLDEEGISQSETEEFLEGGNFSLENVQKFLSENKISKQALEKLGEIFGLLN